MSIPNYLINLTLIVLMVGCSTVRVSQDYDPAVDFSRMRSFAWQYESQPQTGDARIDNSLMDRRIRGAVEKNLIAAGFTEMDRNAADFLVAYQLGIQRQIQSDDVNTRFGFGFGRGWHFGSIALGTGTEVTSYDEGLLLIDVLDPLDHQLLWRGKGTDYLREHTDPEQSTQQINEMVQKMMAQFPPTGK